MKMFSHKLLSVIENIFHQLIFKPNACNQFYIFKLIILRKTNGTQIEKGDMRNWNLPLGPHEWCNMIACFPNPRKWENRKDLVMNDIHSHNFIL